MIGARSSSVDVDMMVFDHQHHDECSANRVEYRFKSKHCQPSRVMSRRQERMHCERHQKDTRMQAWHHDGRGTRITRSASLSPKFKSDEERVRLELLRRRRSSHCRLQHSGNLTEPQPECGADKGRERQYAPALEQPYSVPDHAAGDEGRRAGRCRRQFN